MTHTGGAPFATLVLLAVAPAGCVTTPFDSQSNPVGGRLLEEETAPGIRFAAPVVVDGGRQGSEPGLAIGPDGAILVCSIRGVPKGTDLWRSADQGATFAYVGTVPVEEAPVMRSGAGDAGGGDCDLAFDQGGRAYMVDLWIGSTSIASSSDDGQSWTGLPFSTVAAPIDRPWVLGGEPNEVFVTGQQFGNQAPVGGIWVARSTDGGVTFPQQVLAAENNGNRPGLNGNLAIGAGNLYLVYTRYAPGTTEILDVMIAVSSDRGETWTEHVAAKQPIPARNCFRLFVFPVVAADDSGGVYLTWVASNPTTGRFDLFFVSSRDAGESWNSPILLSDRAGTRAFPWLASDGHDNVGIAWYETSTTALYGYTSSPQGTLGLECGWDRPVEDAEWFLHYASTKNPGSPNPRFDYVVADPAPIHKGGMGRPYAERMQVAFDPLGRAAIVYVADTSEADARPMFVLQSG